MTINMQAKRMTVADDKDVVEFEHKQRGTIAALLKQALGFKPV